MTSDILRLDPQRDVHSSVLMAVAQVMLPPDYAPEQWRRCPDGSGRRSCWGAREAIAVWLARQAGYERDGSVPPESIAVAAHFGALPEAEQQAWLRANFVALREGQVTLAMLP